MKSRLPLICFLVVALMLAYSPSAAQTSPAAHLETTPAEFKARGLEATPQVWEDGLRISGRQAGEFEWWYFDAKLTDGSIVVATYMVSILPIGPIGALVVSITTPDGKTQSKQLPFLGYNVASVSTKQTDISLGSSYFRGDLDTYHSFADPASLGGIGWDLTLTRIAPSYRPGTGFVSAGDTYFAWFNAVPFGHVTGTLTYNDQTVEVQGDGYHDHNWGNIAMPTFIEDWWWGRMQMGDYTVVASNVHYAKEFGDARVPGLVIFKGKELVLDSVTALDKVTFSLDDIQPHPDPKRGDLTAHALARTVKYQYENGDQKATLVFKAGNLIASASLLNSAVFTILPANSPLRNNTKIAPWYTRFASTGQLTLGLTKYQDTVTGSGTLERMEFR